MDHKWTKWNWKIVPRFPPLLQPSITLESSGECVTSQGHNDELNYSDWNPKTCSNIVLQKSYRKSTLFYRLRKLASAQSQTLRKTSCSFTKFWLISRIEQLARLRAQCQCTFSVESVKAHCRELNAPCWDLYSWYTSSCTVSRYIASLVLIAPHAESHATIHAKYDFCIPRRSQISAARLCWAWFCLLPRTKNESCFIHPNKSKFLFVACIQLQMKHACTCTQAISV